MYIISVLTIFKGRYTKQNTYTDFVNFIELELNQTMNLFNVITPFFVLKYFILVIRLPSLVITLNGLI